MIPGKRRHVQLAPFPSWHPSFCFQENPSLALLSDPDVLRASPKGGRALLGRSGRGARGGQEPQSQICRQDEQCMLGARNIGPGGVPSCWPGFGCPQAEGPRGGVWCEHSVSPPRTLGQRLFSLSPTPPRVAQVPTQSPQAGVGAFPAPAPACCHLTSTPAACLRIAHFSDVGAENEASALVSGRVRTS